MECIFCAIANKAQSADVLWEGEQFIAFKDIHPKAPVHVLLIPRKHIESVNHIEDGDSALIGELILAAQKIARTAGVSETGYKLVFNVGRGGGQVIDHLHLHILGGW